MNLDLVPSPDSPDATPPTAIASPSPSSPASAPARATAHLSVWALVGLLAGPFLSMVDANIVNVALPDIASQLHAPLATAQWIISAYLLSLAVVLPASAYLAKRFGTRRIYLASLVGFTLASLACAFAPDLSSLVGARILQGALGAPLIPLAMNVLFNPQTQQQSRTGPLAAAAGGVALFLAPALGPSVGGLLIDVGGWPLIFLVNVPFGLLGLLGAWRIPLALSGRGDHAARFDPLGLLVLGAGLGLAIYGATQGASRGWTDAEALPYWAAGAGLLVFYVLWALIHQHPALDLKLLRHPQSALSIGLAALASVVMFAMLLLIPVFLEQLQGQTPLVAGLALLPQGLVTGLGTALGTALPRRWGVRWSVVLGMVLLTASTASLLTVRLDTAVWVIAALLSGRGLAVGLAIQPLLFALTAGLEATRIADTNTLFNVSQRLGGAVGIALLATFFQAREQLHIGQVLHGLGIDPASLSRAAGGTGGGVAALPLGVRSQLAQAALSGFQDTIWLLVTLALVGSVAALLLRGRSGRVAGGRHERASEG
jgi:EmrB/QacA subfamily drug resistance transporter